MTYFDNIIEYLISYLLKKICKINLLNGDLDFISSINFNISQEYINYNLENLNIPINGEITIKKLVYSKEDNYCSIEEIILNTYISKKQNIEVKKSIFDFITNQINNIIEYNIKNLVLNIKKVSWVYTDIFKIDITINDLNINKLIEIDIGDLKMVFSSNNYIKFDNIKCILSLNNLEIDKIILLDILNLDISIEPIFLLFLKKLKYQQKQIKSKTLEIIDVNIQYLNLKFLELSYIILDLQIKNNFSNIFIANQTVYNKNINYIKLSNFKYNNDFILDSIDILFDENCYNILINILEFIESFIDKPIVKDSIKNEYILLDNINNNDYEMNILEKKLDKKIINKLKIGNINIQFNNKIPILNINIERIKIINYNDNSQYFRIFNINIRDLTEKKWDYILYKSNNNNFLEICLHNISNKSFNLSININDFILNIDQYCLKLILPLINNLLEEIPRVLKLIPNKQLIINKVQSTSFSIIISYKPRGINLVKMIQGDVKELLHLGSIHDFTINLPQQSIYNCEDIGDAYGKIMINLLKIFEKKAIFFILKNENLKMIMLPFNHLTTEMDLKKYFKNISIDLLEIFRKSCDTLGKSNMSILNKPSNLFKNIIVFLQNKVDKNRVKNINMKYKDERY